jgi:hypothetical protein
MHRLWWYIPILLADTHSARWRFLHVPRRKLLCLSKMSLFVQCSGSGKRREPTQLRGLIFQHVTLSGNLSHVRFCGVAHNEARRI